MDTAKARKAMVDCQVRPNDVPDVRLQTAMETIPRELFVPSNRRALAYVEKDVPLFDNRFLLQARDFSKLVHAANIKETDLVLDVGCGYGYSSAVIAQMASVVVGLEDTPEIVEKAGTLVEDFSLDNVAIVENPLSEGFPNQGPYDVIIIAAGVEAHLDGLMSQLSEEGGRLVTIVMKHGVGHATLFIRHGDAIGERQLFESQPSNILPGFAKEPAFEF